MTRWSAESNLGAHHCCNATGKLRQGACFWPFFNHAVLPAHCRALKGSQSFCLTTHTHTEECSSRGLKPAVALLQKVTQFYSELAFFLPFPPSKRQGGKKKIVHTDGIRLPKPALEPVMLSWRGVAGDVIVDPQRQEAMKVVQPDRVPGRFGLEAQTLSTQVSTKHCKQPPHILKVEVPWRL